MLLIFNNLNRYSIVVDYGSHGWYVYDIVLKRLIFNRGATTATASREPILKLAHHIAIFIINIDFLI